MTHPTKQQTTLRWRKKPVVIEAWKIHRPEDGPSGEPPMWLSQAVVDGIITFFPAIPCVMIDTREGRMRADPGDWIIQGIQGEVYPCKPDIFEATYEPA